MKKKIFLTLFCLLTGGMLVSCENDDLTLTFTQNEYTLKNNEGISVVENYKGVSYRMIGDINENIHLDSETGIFTFDDEVLNNTQVLCVAEYKNVVSNPCLVNFILEYETAEISFLNLSNYIVDGEYVTAIASLPYALTYSLKEYVPGVTINSSTGKVNFTNRVLDGSEFTVVASTHNEAKCEKKFIALRDHFVVAKNERQITEKGSKSPVKFVLDYDDAMDFKKDGILALTSEQNEFISEDLYKYNKETGALSISAEYLNTLDDGVTILKAITSLNAVSLQVDIATKFIYTCEDLASIDDSKEALEGYYILVNDLDLTDYLSIDGKGYNGGKGWTPIGSYEDVLDVNKATALSFKGTFDGNGHVIRGLYSNRKDVNSFNAGLFGYTTSSSCIKNLGVTGSLNVSSYSGGFVGSNNGVISDCWADVDITVESGENVYRYVGGFVGNNFGTIKNCYSLGDVVSDHHFGAFVGSNEGVIESCYGLESPKCHTFAGMGLMSDSCKLFASLDEMTVAKWDELLSHEYWNIKVGELPTLKYLIQDNALRKISIKKLPKNHYFKGDNIPFEVEIYPLNLQEEYLPKVKYETDVKGTYFENNVLNTLNAKENEIKVRVSILEDDVLFSDEMTITLGKKIESLQVLSVLDMKAGCSYKVGASYLPTDAREDITYRISGDFLDGVSIKDDIITISEESKCSEFSLVAQSENGIKSSPIKINVQQLTRLSSQPIILYENDSNDISFELPNSIIDVSTMDVKVFNKKIDYTLNGNMLTINKNSIKDIKDVKIPIIITANGKRYLEEVYFMSHVRYDLEYVEQVYSDCLKISSKEDFYKYFNNKFDENYDETKLQNYDKCFVLTNDIDFNGDTIYGIGYGDNSFNGKFFGNGHTISNFKIKSNESKKIVAPNEISPLYGVGLFGSLDGEVYDLNISNAQISGNNFVGGFAGIMKGGKIENCQIFDSFISASGYSISQEDIRVAAIVGRPFGGECLACFNDGTSKNLIG